MPETSTTPDRGYMGDPRRSASHGRAARRSEAPDPAPLFHLRRVRLDAGGYDPGGAYWGHGGTLFEAFSVDGAEFMTLRVWRSDAAAALQASGTRIAEGGDWWRTDWTREAAKAAVREAYPAARFFR